MAYPHSKGIHWQIVETMPTNPEPLVYYWDLSDAATPAKVRGLDGVDYAFPTKAKAESSHEAGSSESTSIFQYRVAGSTATAAITSGDWRDVPLATTVVNGIASASIDSSVVTLPAGTYRFEYFGTGWMAETSAFHQKVQVRLYDVDGTAEVAGSGGSVEEFDLTTGQTSTPSIGLTSHGACVATLESETDIKLQIQVATTGNYAPESYTSQVCAQLKITKTA